LKKREKITKGFEKTPKNQMACPPRRAVAFYNDNQEARVYKDHIIQCGCAGCSAAQKILRCVDFLGS